MISTQTALDALSKLVTGLGAEQVPLIHANGRVLAKPAVATRNQPPFDASSMDGYAIAASDMNIGVDCWQIIGESAAGHNYAGSVETGQAVRIFTGAPLPQGTDHVVIQEHTERDGDTLTICDGPNTKSYVRPLGDDFKAGFQIDAGQRLTPHSVALLASMNIDQVWVTRKPRIALIATGDELVQPGEAPGPDQIIASNTYGLFAMLKQAGADPRLLPIARDRISSLKEVYERAIACDLIVTIGGASVGDHDLVAVAGAQMGLEQSFYKVAMRPGKPLMAGKMGTTPMIGLPGNPVSALVCGEIFLKPIVEKMQGLPFAPRSRSTAILDHDLSENGPREHYMRAMISDGTVRCDFSQDSALLHILHQANALVVRPPNDQPRAKGDLIDIIQL